QLRLLAPPPRVTSASCYVHPPRTDPGLPSIDTTLVLRIENWELCPTSPKKRHKLSTSACRKGRLKKSIKVPGRPMSLLIGNESFASPRHPLCQQVERAFPFPIQGGRRLFSDKPFYGHWYQAAPSFTW